jgi:putative membrane fusion protein
MVSLFGEDISTFAAGVTTETDSLSGTGYIFRDETVLRSSNGGVVDYLCADGTKVASGQELAKIHSEGSQKDRKAVEKLDRQIAILEKSSDSSVTSIDIANLQQDIADDYYILVRMLAGGQTGELSVQINEFLVGMDKLSVLTEDESAVTGTLGALKAQKEEMIKASGSAAVESAQKGGYFYTSADGYEEVFTMKAFDELTSESFVSLISDRRTLSNSEGVVYGKLADNSQWGFVMEISDKKSDRFEEGQTYTVEFTENNGVGLPMTLARKIDCAQRGSVLLVFECDRLPERFEFNRCQSVSIELDSISGIYVPKKAVDTVDGNEGVYILRGSVVHFRYIYIVYEGSDYYLVSEEGPEDSFVYLAPNDLIILNGTNLFEGRILE